MLVKAQNKEQLFAEAMPEGIIMLDENGCILWWNQVAKKLLCLENKNDLGSLVTNVLTLGSFHELYNKARYLESIEFDSPKKPEYRISLSLRPYRENHLIVILTDVTKTYRFEAMRQDFIANVSHELRTPLTVFRGYLEILQDQEHLDKEQFQEMLDHMCGQSERMGRLVQDLLLLSRLESDRTDKEMCQQLPIAKMLKDIVDNAKLLSGAHQHEFILELDEELELIGHPDELQSAFSNIIYNAVRYTPAKGKITIRWYADKTGKHFEVSDTGIGISSKYISRITQRFYRVDKARLSGRGGTGIGLAIVKHVLLRHKGTLEIKSKLNIGSTFRCNFSSDA